MITVIGCDGSTLGERARDALAQATLVVGAPRHVAAAGLAPGTPTVVLGNVDEAMCRLAGHAGGSGDTTRHASATVAPTTPGGPAAVLASGDPGFFGIVRRLRAAGLAPQVLPAVSSVALAFARIGLPWDDAVVVSAHGRDPRPALAAARAGGKVAVLTSPECGTAQVGAAVAGWDKALVVCERLGAPDERVVHIAPEQAADRQWRAPNVVLVLASDPAADDPAADDPAAGDPAACSALRGTSAPLPDPGWVAGGEATPAGWALPDDAFEHRAGMLTKYEVRAVALSRLAPRRGTLVWDVGACSGSVAVECARFGAAVLAVERDADEVARIGRNARAHRVAVRAVLGVAPEALGALPDPDAVFVGGGGPAVVDACAARRPRRIVVALAAVERIGPTTDVLTHAGYAADGVLVHASRLTSLPGGVHRLAATNPVALVWGVRG
ncbi:MAG: precorrin-6y C5,15-methyltransferase (decarboxylating) subunit CbiE [Blastococcus sp.]